MACSAESTGSLLDGLVQLGRVPFLRGPAGLEQCVQVDHAQVEPRHHADHLVLLGVFVVLVVDRVVQQQRRRTGVLEDGVVPVLDEFLEGGVLLVERGLLFLAGHREQGVGVGLETLGELAARLDERLPGLRGEELLCGGGDVQIGHLGVLPLS